MKHNILGVTLLAGALAVAGPVPAQTPEPVSPRLNARLLDMLRREMIAVLGASLDIQDALVRGEHARVAEGAQAIHDSFIMSQEMTEKDRAALSAALPEAFVARDEEFHTLTGELANAARAGDATRQRELFGDMVRSCPACHERYATDRFPGFADK